MNKFTSDDKEGNDEGGCACGGNCACGGDECACGEHEEGHSHEHGGEGCMCGHK